MSSKSVETPYARVAKQAVRAEASSQGVKLHRHAAELALERFTREGDPQDLERARAHLEEAARRRKLEGACQAALALARLEARHGDRPEDAYLAAYRVVARFGREAARRACVDEARLILAALDATPAGAGELAAIDADPDADDPSVPLQGPQAAPVDRAPAGVELTSMDVYAAEADPGARGSARVVLRFDANPVFRRGEREAGPGRPRQVVFDFEDVRVRNAAAASREVGGAALTAVHLEQGPAGARLAFDIAEDATYRLFTLGEPPRLVLDVELAAADRAPSAEGPLVLLDPGHGGEDHGALGYHGRSEAELALDIARRARAWIQRTAPGVRVRMTRESDVLLSLEERAAMANVLEADLFVSVHLNASSDSIDRGGVSTFVLDVNNDRNVLRLAARENHTATSAVSELQFLVGSLARAEQARESRRAAELIQRGTLFGGRRFMPRLYDRGVRSAMFYVLVGAQMPAVLVEASFLTQRAEAELLARVDYRDSLAQGIARGVVQYLQSRTAPP